MYIVYYLPENSVQIEILDTSQTFDGAFSLMSNFAYNKVLKENGEKRAKDAYEFDVFSLERCEVPDGLHLELQVDSVLYEKNNIINVYEKRTVYEKGIFYTAAAPKKQKIGCFCFSAFSLKNGESLPLKVSSAKLEKLFSLEDANVSKTKNLCIEELKNVLQKRNNISNYV